MLNIKLLQIPNSVILFDYEFINPHLVQAQVPLREDLGEEGHEEEDRGGGGQLDALVHRLQERPDVAPAAAAAAPLAGDHGPRDVGHRHVDVEADLNGTAFLCLGSEIGVRESEVRDMIPTYRLRDPERSVLRGEVHAI